MFRPPDRRQDLYVPLLVMWIPVPIVIVTAVVLAEETGLADIVLGFGFLIVLVAWMSAAVLSGLWFAYYLAHRAWIACLLCALLPLTTCQEILKPLGERITLIHAGEYAGYALQLVRWQSKYDRLVATLRPGRRLVAFDESLFTDAGVSIIYDEQDEVTLPKASRPASWRSRTDDGVFDGLCDDVEPLWSHYYIAHFGFGFDC